MKIILITVTLLSFLFIYPAIAEELIVGIYDNPPMVFYENGKPDGFFVELLEYIAKEEGWNLKYIHGSFPDLIEKLKKGEIDILPDVAYTPQRERYISFNNETVFSNWEVVVAKNEIETITELNGMVVAGVKGDVYFESFKVLVKSFGIECEFVELEGDYKDVFREIKDGKADVGIVSRIYGNLYSREYGLKVTPIIFTPVELRFAGAKGKERYLQRIDYHLEILKKDENSIYYTLIGKWTETAQMKTPFWIRYVVLFAVFLILLLGYRELYLKRELSKRKSEIIKVNRLLEKIIRINEAIIVERSPEKLAMKTSEVLSEYATNAVLLFLNDEVFAFSNGDKVDANEVLKYECVKMAISRKSPIFIPKGFHPETCVHGEKAKEYHGYAFPILYNLELKGLIFIRNKDELSGQEKRILETLAGDLAYAIHDFELEKERNVVLEQLKENINNMMVLVDRIKNPLTVIKGLTELKCKEIEGEVEKEIQSILDTVAEIEKGWIESEKLERKLRE